MAGVLDNYELLGLLEFLYHMVDTSSICQNLAVNREFKKALQRARSQGCPWKATWGGHLGMSQWARS